MKHAFDHMDMHGDDVVFFSIYDHPTELVCKEFWDEVNFANGKNPPYLTPAPLREMGDLERNLDALRDFICMTLTHENVEYITATQAAAYEKRDSEPIDEKKIKRFASEFNGGITFGKVGGRMLSASEIFSLFARTLTRRALIPELLYGPEQRVPSEVHDEQFDVASLAEAVYSQYDTVMGCKQLKTLYDVGHSRLNPVDLFCMMAKAIASNDVKVCHSTGRLSASDYVDETYQFGGNWVLWDSNFVANNIVEQTKLQCWTLKPAIV